MTPSPGGTAALRVRVADRDGLHARPCARIAEIALESACEVTLACGGRTANACRIFEMLGLAATGGSEVVVRVRGPGAAACAKRIADVLAAIPPA